MRIIVPKISPRLTKPVLRGFKAFKEAVSTLLTCLWDDAVSNWDSADITWGSDIEYSIKPTIGGIKLDTPKLK